MIGYACVTFFCDGYEVSKKEVEHYLLQAMAPMWGWYKTGEKYAFIFETPPSLGKRSWESGSGRAEGVYDRLRLRHVLLRWLRGE